MVLDLKDKAPALTVAGLDALDGSPACVLGHAFGNRPYPNLPVTIAREEWPALLLAAVAVLGLGLAGAPVWQLLEIRI